MFYSTCSRPPALSASLKACCAPFSGIAENVERMKRVFLSSVAHGLESFRDAACKAINGLDVYHCVRMEDFGARTDSPLEVSVQAVRSCHIFIGIIGQRYGSCPPGSPLSFTELE